MTDPIRLSKRLAELTTCSRREAELYIEGGWVSVDGEVIEEPQFKVLDQRVELLPGARAETIEPATLLLHCRLAPRRFRRPARCGRRWSDDPSPLRALKNTSPASVPPLRWTARLRGWWCSASSTAYCASWWTTVHGWSRNTWSRSPATWPPAASSACATASPTRAAGYRRARSVGRTKATCASPSKTCCPASCASCAKGRGWKCEHPPPAHRRAVAGQATARRMALPRPPRTLLSAHSRPRRARPGDCPQTRRYMAMNALSLA